jgi:hypothetical protein
MSSFKMTTKCFVSATDFCFRQKITVTTLQVHSANEERHSNRLPKLYVLSLHTGFSFHPKAMHSSFDKHGFLFILMKKKTIPVFILVFRVAVPSGLVDTHTRMFRWNILSPPSVLKTQSVSSCKTVAYTHSYARR